MSSIFLKFFNIIFNISMPFHYMSVASFMQILTWRWTESQASTDKWLQCLNIICGKA